MGKKAYDKKWELINKRMNNKFTCYYSPAEKHSLCPHQDNCILNREFQEYYNSIWECKSEMINLKKIYNNAIDLNKETNKPFEELYCGFAPRKNIVRRMFLDNKVKDNYDKLKNLKTKKGGFE